MLTLLYVFCSRLFENVCFLIGSAYFVAGSYPEDGHAPAAEESYEEEEDELNDGVVHSTNPIGKSKARAGGAPDIDL